MRSRRRVIVATLMGFLFGLVCMWLASSSPGELAWPVAAQLVASRTVMGFAIGISCLSLGHWAVHGFVMGGLFSLPVAFGGLLAPEMVEFSKWGLFLWTVILGMIYGLLTEAVTSGMLKARQRG